MKLLLYVVLFCAMFSCALTGIAPAATPLDDFSGNRLDSSKWFGEYWDQQGLIMVREVTVGKLVSKIGGRTDNSGIAHTGTELNYSGDVSSFSAKVNFVEGAYGPSVDDNDMYGLFAELNGFFYKTDEGGGGDVSASIGIRYQENNQGTSLEIAATIYTPSGSQIDAPQFTTTIIPGQEYTLTIAYDKGTNTFTFSVNDGSQTESHDVQGPAWNNSADWPGLRLDTLIIAGTNIIGGGYVHATFDDVMVNGSLHDDFNAPLDSNKWIDHEIVREIRDNRLQMNVQNTYGEPSADNDIYLDSQHITNYLQADVIVSSNSDYDGDAHGEALVHGSFYNSMHDGTASSYNGSEGDIFAGTLVSQDSNGQLQPQAGVIRCEDNQCDQITFLYLQPFSSCQIQADTPTTFSVENREADATIIFHCNQDELSYQLTEPHLYAPSYKFRGLKTSVKSNGNGTGYIKAAFDNVFVKKSRKSPWNLFLPAILSTGAKK